MSAYGLELVTPPATGPITVAEARAHCRIDHDADNAYLAALIESARDYIQRTLQRQIVTATWTLSLDQFPWVIELPISPLVSVEEIEYEDLNGDTQTLPTSEYLVRIEEDPPRIVPTYLTIWPWALPQAGSVRVTFEAGYGESASIPPAIRQAMLMLVAHWYANREGVGFGRDAKSVAIELGIDRLLTTHWDGRY